MFYFSLLILLFSLGAQVKLRSFGLDKEQEKKRRIFKSLFLGAVGAFFIFAGYKTFQQYLIWKSNGPPTEYLLPPYQSIFYLLQYSFIHFFFGYLISLGAALAFLIAAKLLNKKFQQRFFWPEEPYLGAIALFLLGHPLWLVYIPLVLLLSFLVASCRLLVTKKKTRFSLYFLWLPAGIAVFLLGNLVLKI